MDNLYKLSFIDKSVFDKIKNELLTEEIEGNEILKKGIAIVEIGHVPIDATYDEEDNELTEASFHTDWAVDVVSPIEIPELNEYLIEPKSKYRHVINGNFKIVTQ